MCSESMCSGSMCSESMCSESVCSGTHLGGWHSVAGFGNGALAYWSSTRSDTRFSNWTWSAMKDRSLVNSSEWSSRVFSSEGTLLSLSHETQSVKTLSLLP